MLDLWSFGFTDYVSIVYGHHKHYKCWTQGSVHAILFIIAQCLNCNNGYVPTLFTNPTFLALSAKFLTTLCKNKCFLDKTSTSGYHYHTNFLVCSHTHAHSYSHQHPPNTNTLSLSLHLSLTTTILHGNSSDSLAQHTCCLTHLTFIAIGLPIRPTYWRSVIRRIIIFPLWSVIPMNWTGKKGSVANH